MGRERGIVVVNKKTVGIDGLHFQICPFAHSDVLWNGDSSGHVQNSPHVKFIQLRMRKGRKKAMKRLPSTDYYKMYEYWDACNYGGGGRTPKYIIKKANSILDLFDSISKKGFNKKSRIQVLKIPLWISRGFSGGDDLGVPEIFHGHHRIACLYVLGIKSVNVDMCRDDMIGSLHWPQNLSRMGNINHGS